MQKKQQQLDMWVKLGKASENSCFSKLSHQSATTLNFINMERTVEDRSSVHFDSVMLQWFID